MANAVLVDSNFYISRIRTRRDPLLELGAAANHWTIFTCGQVTLEVCRGFRDADRRLHYQKAFAAMAQVPVTDSTWTRALALTWEMGQRGTSIRTADLIIAACALSVNAPVLTDDRDFKAIPGLAVLDSLV